MSIDLSGLGRVFKGESKPVVDCISVQVQKTDTLSAGVLKVIKDAGFNTDKVYTSEDGKTLTFSQTGAAPATEGVELVRLSDQVVVTMKGFQPGHDGMKDADFGETASSNSWYQGLDGTLDTFFQKACAAMSNAADEKEAAKQIGTLCDGLKNYLTSLTKNLPTAAFKADLKLRHYLEAAMAEPTTKGDIKDIEAFMTQLQKAPEGFAEPEWTAMSPVDKIAWLQANTAKKEDGAIKCEKCDSTDGYDVMSEDDKKKTHAKHLAEKKDITTEPVAAKPKTDAEKAAEKVTGQQEITVKSDMDKVLEAIAGVSTKVDGIETKVGTLTTSVGEISKKQEDDKKVLDALTQKSEDLTQTLATTLTAPPKGEDTPSGRQGVTKADDDPRTGCFDTANISRAKKMELMGRRRSA